MQDTTLKAPTPTRFRLLRRSNRVIALVSITVLLSLADLYMTLMHLSTIGMLEGNPLARWIMRNLQPSAIIMWKTLTLLIAGAILIKLRHKVCAEVAAWICAVILVWLMVRWAGYSDHLTQLSVDEMVLVSESHESDWIMPGSGR